MGKPNFALGQNWFDRSKQRNLIFVPAAQVFSRLLSGLIGTVTFALTFKYLGINSFAILVTLLTLLGINQIIDTVIAVPARRNLAGTESNLDLSFELSKVLRLTLISAAFSFVGILFIGLFVLFFVLKIVSLNLFCVVIILSFASTFLVVSNSISRGLEGLDFQLTAILVTPISSILLFITSFLAIRMDLGVIGIVGANLITNLVTALGLATLLSSRIEFTGMFNRQRFFRSSSQDFSRKYIFFLSVLACSLFISYSLDPWLIQYFLEDSDVAIYAVHSKFYALLMAAPFAFTPLLWRSEKIKGSTFSGLLKKSLTLFTFSVLIFLIGWPITSFLVNYLTGGEIEFHSEIYLSMGLLGSLISFQIPLSAGMLSYQGIKFQVISCSIMATLNFILSVLLINRIGIVGCVISSSIALIACQILPILIHKYRIRESL